MGKSCSVRIAQKRLKPRQGLTLNTLTKSSFCLSFFSYPEILSKVARMYVCHILDTKKTSGNLQHVMIAILISFDILLNLVIRKKHACQCAGLAASREENLKM